MNSIGKDIATIRLHLSLTLEDIHERTRIPLSTLKRIENDSIFHDQDENKTYIRSFVRTYAKTLDITDEMVSKALDQLEAGNYNRLLLDAYPDIAEKGPPPHLKPDISEEDKEGRKKQEAKPTSQSPPAFAKESRTAGPDSSPKSVDWARIVSEFSSVKKRTPAWLIGLVVVLAILVVSIYFLRESDQFNYEFGLPDTGTTEPPAVTEPEDSGLSLDLADEQDVDTMQDEETGAESLDETLFLKLYAAYDKLEPVRVWSDLKPQIDPYWLEQGQAINFEFRDTIRISGQYNRMILFLNGHRIDDFRQQHFNQQENAVELTRDFFSGDDKWTSPVALELPEDTPEPDSVIARPTF